MLGLNANLNYFLFNIANEMMEKIVNYTINLWKSLRNIHKDAVLRKS